MIVMGNSICCRSIDKFIFGPPPSRVLLLGLDAVGKTTMLYKLKLKETVATIPTVGFNVETVQLTKNATFTIWDVGGGAKIYPLWRHYFNGTQGIMYIVDASDSSRFSEAKRWLDMLLDSDELVDVLIFLLANKQDLPHAISPSEVAMAMGLDDAGVDGGRVRVRGTSTMTGDGVQEAMMELHEMIQRNQ